MAVGWLAVAQRSISLSTSSGGRDVDANGFGERPGAGTGMP